MDSRFFFNVLPIQTLRRLRGRANIAAQLLQLGLGFLETLLHDITYADDPIKCSVANNRQVPNALKRHYLHEFDNRVLWRTSF